LPRKDPEKYREYMRGFMEKQRNEKREEFLKEYARQRIPKMILDIQERIDRGDRDPRRIREMEFLRMVLQSERFWRLGFCPSCQKTVWFGEESDPNAVKIRFPEDYQFPNQDFPIQCSKCMMSEMHAQFGYPSEEKNYDRKNMFGEVPQEEDAKPKCENCGKRRPAKQSPRGWCNRCEVERALSSRISPIEGFESRPKSSGSHMSE
jgi:hypothetical protein